MKNNQPQTIIAKTKHHWIPITVTLWVIIPIILIITFHIDVEAHNTPGSFFLLGWIYLVPGLIFLAAKITNEHKKNINQK